MKQEETSSADASGELPEEVTPADLTCLLGLDLWEGPPRRLGFRGGLHLQEVVGV